MKREERHQAITRLIKARKLKNMVELREALAEEGIIVSNATLSRDLQILKIVKVADAQTKSKIFVQSLAEVDPYAELRTEIHDEVVDVIVNGFLVVIKAVPYWTDSISDLIDRSNFEEVISTLAGYDNMWIMTKDEESAQRFANKIRKLQQ